MTSHPFTSNTTVPNNFADTKRHYAILDGLRGVATIIVVIFHIFETHSTSHFDQIINHGYLAVDFFFVLSGFVIGYAYDDRWEKMSLIDFFKRRLIRLHPMIIISMIIGASTYYFQVGETFSVIADTPAWKLLLTMLIGMTLLPVGRSMNIRGWSEMHPLNGPAWSLFFEYIANILYALFIRKFSNIALSLLVFIAGCATLHFALTNPKGDMIGGWSLNAKHLEIGFTRLMYPFFAGLLLSRVGKLTSIKHAFSWCSLILIAMLFMPRIGDENSVWMNGCYDAFCIIVIFPLIVYLGASGELNTRMSEKTCTFLGNISYPIYIVHYPFIYIYTALVLDNKLTFEQALPYAVLTVLASLVTAYLCLKLYDIPLRRWLSDRFIARAKHAEMPN